MSRDRLTPIERSAAYSRGEALDRRRVPIVGNTAARAGVKVWNFAAMAGSSPTHIAAYRWFGYDVDPASSPTSIPRPRRWCTVSSS